MRLDEHKSSNQRVTSTCTRFAIISHSFSFCHGTEEGGAVYVSTTGSIGIHSTKFSQLHNWGTFDELQLFKEYRLRWRRCIPCSKNQWGQSQSGVGVSHCTSAFVQKTNLSPRSQKGYAITALLLKARIIHREQMRNEMAMFHFSSSVEDS